MRKRRQSTPSKCLAKWYTKKHPSGISERMLLFCTYLGGKNIGGLGALLAVLNVERDRLSFLQRIKLAVAGGKMEEYICTAFRSDETETLFGLFLDSACRHVNREKKRKNTAEEYVQPCAYYTQLFCLGKWQSIIL